jgi:hypothetical protein
LVLKTTELPSNAIHQFYYPIYVDAQNVQKIYSSGCEWCFALNSAYMPSLTQIAARGFYACVSLVYLDA